MKILIVGAGPAGLALATLLGRSGRSHDITVLERNPPGEHPGWGITLRSNALSFLALDTMIAPQVLEGRTLFYRGEKVVDLPYPAGVGNTAVSRAELLAALVKCATSAGAHIRFDVDGGRLTPSELAVFDLVVAADGAHSALRQLYATSFCPTVTSGRNRYGWLAVEEPFHRLTVMLEDRSTPLLAWAYKHTDALSTLIVESTKETLASSGLADLPPEEACAFIGEVFENTLGSARVLSRGPIRWQAFPQVSCERLWHRNVVLVGDAAHTTHFSQGFGTMFAFDDALALHDALHETVSVEDAFARYESSQRPKIAKLQETSSASMRWAEDFVDAAERHDERQARTLIAARWPNNDVPPAPLSSPDIDRRAASNRAV